METTGMQAKIYAQNAGQVGYAGDKSITPIGSLQEALKHVQSLAHEIRMTTDRLCGSQPESVNATKDPGQPISLFSQIDDVARQLQDVASMLSSDNQRIQARL